MQGLLRGVYSEEGVNNPNGITHSKSLLSKCFPESVKAAFVRLGYASEAPLHMLTTGKTECGSTNIQVYQLNKVERAAFYILIGPLMSVANAVYHAVAALLYVGRIFLVPFTNKRLKVGVVGLCHHLNSLVRNVIQAVPFFGFFLTLGFDKLEAKAWNIVRAKLKLPLFENPYEAHFGEN